MFTTGNLIELKGFDFNSGGRNEKSNSLNMGIIIGSDNVVTLDAYTNKLIGLNTNTGAVLKIGEEVFGKWDRTELDYITEDMIRPFK